jgi:hypothetical protein
MVDPTRAICTLTAVLALASGGDDRKPSLSLKATPPLGFSPLRVRVTVDLRGGSDSYADLYCPEVEWEWGDDVTSSNSGDCDPYEAGKSTIRRHYSAEHVYRQAGAYKIVFRLKQKDRVVSSSSANVQVRAGLRDDFGN